MVLILPMQYPAHAMLKVATTHPAYAHMVPNVSAITIINALKTQPSIEIINGESSLSIDLFMPIKSSPCLARYAVMTSYPELGHMRRQHIILVF